MSLDHGVALAAVGDWVVALIFIALLVSWWTFIGWWLSRFGAREVSATFPAAEPPADALRDWTDYGIEGKMHRLMAKEIDKDAARGPLEPVTAGAR